MAAPRVKAVRGKKGVARFSRPSLYITGVSVVAVLVLLGILSQSMGSAEAPRDGSLESEKHVGHFVPFKCQRSFDQLASFKPKHTPKNLNCWMGAIEVVSAKATFAKSLEGSAGIRFEMSAYLERQLLKAVYRISLKSIKTGTTVNYDGFSDVGEKIAQKDISGYEMCCNFVHGAVCGWERHGDLQENTVKSCALRTPEAEIDATRDEYGKSGFMFSGNVTKPLHTLTDGIWEVKFTMLDGFGSSIGRVVAHVNIHQSDLMPSGKPEGTALDLSMVSGNSTQTESVS